MGSCCSSRQNADHYSPDVAPLNHPSREMAGRMAPSIINATSKHSATVIFLHGLGDTGQGWCEEFRRFAHPWIKFIFPHAPSQPVSLNGGMSMPSWFDIKGLSPNAPQDEDGIKASSSSLMKLINDEKSHVPTERIVIGGFSQGGAVALYTALTTSVKVGGVLAFSTWLPLHDKIMGQLSGINSRVPILQCHGDIDPMVPISMGNLTAMFLKQINPDHTLITLQGVMHSSSEQEMKECKEFLKKSLPEN